MRVIFATLAILLMVSTSWAQDEIAAVIDFTSTPPVIDGLGDDAVWANATAHGTDEFFELPGDSPNDGDDDLQVTWKSLWDNENLYFFVEVKDDVIINEDSLDWQDDSVEFYIDAQNLDVENYQPDIIDPETDEEQRFPAYQITGLAGCTIEELCGEFRIREDSTSVFTHGTNSYARGDPAFEDDDDLVTYPRGADTSVSLITDDNTYTYEVAFPWEALFDTPANIMERGEMGFGLAINDDDDEGGRDSQWMWATEAGDLWMRSDTFPSVALEGGASGVAGDFNGNGERDSADLDLLAAAASDDLTFDVNGDGTVDAGDRAFWIEDLTNTFFGDSNFDGQFNSSDFVKVFTAAKYETGQSATWDEGDWNGDGEFSSADFVTAFTGAGYEAGERNGGLMVVPEPSTIGLAAIGLLSLIRRRRR